MSTREASAPSGTAREADVMAHGTAPSAARLLHPLVVPLFELQDSGRGGHVRRRTWRRQGHLALANEFLASCNWLLGSRVSTPGASSSPQHDAMRTRAARLALHWDRCSGDRSNDEAALRELLKGRAVYDAGEAPTTLRPFKMNQVSLPADVSSSPELASLVSPDAPMYLGGFGQRVFFSKS